MTKSETKLDLPIIANNFVTCYSDRLLIDLYYFPFGNKTIQYNDIVSCELLQIDDLGFSKIKTWGMALSPIWWHSDLRRHFRKSCIIIDTNQWPKIGLTMDDNDIISVYKLIKQKMSEYQSTKNSSEKKSFSDIEKMNNNTNDSLSEKELEYRRSLENNK